jgi:predicted acetyltransferase
MRLSFRTARADDLERLIDVHATAFPDPRNRDARARNFCRNPLGDLDDLWVAVSAASGDVVAHAFLFRLRAWFGGRLVAAGGVASVGVAPEARGRGVGSALVEHLHGVSSSRGDALTVLYPFRQSFYARLGYAPTSAYHRLRIAPASVPWSLGLAVRSATGGDRAALQACWDVTGARHSGALARADRFWDARLADDANTWLVVEGPAGVEGYIAWRLEQVEPHAATTMTVVDRAARTDEGARSLWALVGAQRGQVAEVRFDIASDDPIECALVDADRARFGDAQVEHVLGEVAAGPMVRVPDLQVGLEARGYEADGHLVLSVGEECFELTVAGGRGVVSRGSHADPHLRMDARTLSAAALGGLDVSSAHRFGWLEARDAHSLGLADALLGLPAYFSPDPF